MSQSQSKSEWEPLEDNHHPKFYFNGGSLVFWSNFDHLLCYIYMGLITHPKTDAFLVSLLKLCIFFQFKDGVAHVIKELTLKGAKFHPALQFELTRCYRVDRWIEPAFRWFMEVPITSLRHAP
ncbi:hypothetical protein DFH09DRAFT_1089140 [Mycena vulgaris]|nr:hypothetical protein DFH09DRAFT_1089140 [Mycena vulgaris]